jgi:hypothetical protein
MFPSLKNQQHRYATSKVSETSKGAAKGSKTTSKKDLKQVTTFFLHGGGGPNLLCG